MNFGSVQKDLHTSCTDGSYSKNSLKIRFVLQFHLPQGEKEAILTPHRKRPRRFHRGLASAAGFGRSGYGLITTFTQPSLFSWNSL